MFLSCTHGNKPQPSDNLLLCFCASGDITGHRNAPEAGKLIYGEGQRSKTVKVSEHVVRTQQIIDAIRSTCSSSEPPRLVLNKHCAVCDFQSRCRNASIEHDDLSLLTAMSSKERAKLNEKGIFTIMQLLYTGPATKAHQIGNQALYPAHQIRPQAQSSGDKKGSNTRRQYAIS